MKRRDFLKLTGYGTAVGVVAKLGLDGAATAEALLDPPPPRLVWEPPKLTVGDYDPIYLCNGDMIELAGNNWKLIYLREGGDLVLHTKQIVKGKQH